MLRKITRAEMAMTGCITLWLVSLTGNACFGAGVGLIGDPAGHGPLWPPGDMDSQGRAFYPSPDGRYVVEISGSDVEDLTIRRVSGAHASGRSGAALFTAHCISSLYWLPRHRHTLAFTTTALWTDSRGLLALWDGRLRVLLPRRRTRYESLALEAVSRDGCRIYFNEASLRQPVTASKQIKRELNESDLEQYISRQAVAAYNKQLKIVRSIDICHWRRR